MYTVVPALGISGRLKYEDVKFWFIPRCSPFASWVGSFCLLERYPRWLHTYTLAHNAVHKLCHVAILDRVAVVMIAFLAIFFYFFKFVNDTQNI